jgi:hypothetical protein
VVQDSYHKDVRVDLAAIIEQMGDSLGWRAFARHDFSVLTTMARIHTAVRKAKRPYQRCETLLMFQANA